MNNIRGLPCPALIFLVVLSGVSSLAICVSSCDRSQRPASRLFSEESPQNDSFKTELTYLELTRKLPAADKKSIEDQIIRAEETLSIPKALLWCVLFQESRFDTFKNATTTHTAKGLGQFTPFALSEINNDTDHYDPRTSSVLGAHLQPSSLPLNFQLKLKPKSGRRTPAAVTAQPITSYYRNTTAVMASAAYLNNRYQQLKAALDHQGISYDPDVLWIYAAAAYNKGSRSVFSLLTHEYMSRGERAVSELLSDPKAAHDLFSHYRRLEYPLRHLWAKRVRSKYIYELLKNMQIVYSCALTEQSI